ncbi:MAG: DsbA family protein [Alphaproteobacteria bacterium]|nr:DsbA family protein [Alphaproteobacteria bacterium]
MNNRVLVIAAAVVLALAGGFALYWSSRPVATPVVAARPAAAPAAPATPAAPAATPAPAAEVAALPPATVLPEVAAQLRDRVLGNPDAPVTIIEYASFTCPHCANFHNVIMKDLKARYIETGKVKLIFRDFPLDALALRASAIARCAPEPAYYGFVEVLFKSQATWMAGGGARSLGQLEGIARLGGMSKEDFDACMTNDALLEGIINGRQEAMTVYKVDSTPSFVIGGKTYGGDKPIDELAKLIDPLLPKN